MTASAIGSAASASAAALVDAGTSGPLVITLVPVEVPHGAYDGRIPQRMRWLHPDAAEAFKPIADAVVVSDMYRSAEASLNAMQKKAGVLPPGRSRHGYGLAIDLSVSESMKLVGVKSKEAFDDWMAHRHWHCHRIDHLMQIESWHFNWLPAFTGVLRNERSTNPAGERQLLAMYGDALSPGPHAQQAALSKLGLYRGEIDGLLGPLSKQAADAFMRAWRCTKASYLRTLAFVAAELHTPDSRLIDVARGVSR